MSCFNTESVDKVWRYTTSTAELDYSIGHVTRHIERRPADIDVDHELLIHRTNRHKVASTCFNA